MSPPAPWALPARYSSWTWAFSQASATCKSQRNRLDKGHQRQETANTELKPARASRCRGHFGQGFPPLVVARSVPTRQAVCQPVDDGSDLRLSRPSSRRNRCCATAYGSLAGGRGRVHNPRGGGIRPFGRLFQLFNRWRRYARPRKSKVLRLTSELRWCNPLALTCVPPSESCFRWRSYKMGQVTSTGMCNTAVSRVSPAVAKHGRVGLTSSYFAPVHQRLKKRQQLLFLRPRESIELLRRFLGLASVEGDACSSVVARPSCRYGPESRTPHSGGVRHSWAVAQRRAVFSPGALTNSCLPVQGCWAADWAGRCRTTSQHHQARPHVVQQEVL